MGNWAYKSTLSVCFGLFLPSISMAAPEYVQSVEETIVEASPLETVVKEIIIKDSSTTNNSEQIFSDGLEETVETSGVGGVASGSGNYNGYGQYDSGQYIQDGDEIVTKTETVAYEAPVETVKIVNRPTESVQSQPVPVLVTKQKAAEYYVDSRVYVSGLGGVVANTSLDNVSPLGGGGLALGVRFNDNFSIEGTGLFSAQETSHQFCPANDPNCSFDSQSVGTSNVVDQYMFGLGAHYHFFFGQKLVPFIGAKALYTIRDHTSRQTLARQRSQAFDVGPHLGVEYLISKKWSVGASWSYLTNLNFGLNASTSNNEDASVEEVGASMLTSFEQTDFQMILGTLRYTF